MELEKYLDIALKITDKASDYLLKNFGKMQPLNHKTGFHYGIKEDLRLNDFYEQELRSLTPGIGLFTEEGEKNLSEEMTWVVDPIEGTSNFRAGIQFYATQIALLYKAIPVVSVIRAPSLNLTYHALKGGGSYINSKKLKISKIKEMKKAIISIGKGTKEDDLMWYGGIMGDIMASVRSFRHFGACGLEMAYAAEGKIDIYINKGSNNIYDYSAGSLIAKEAGAEVMDFDGNNWTIEKDTIVITNRYLMPGTLSLLTAK